MLATFHVVSYSRPVAMAHFCISLCPVATVADVRCYRIA